MSDDAFGKLTVQQKEYVDVIKRRCPEAIAIWYAPSAYSELGIDMDFGLELFTNKDWPVKFIILRTEGLQPLFVMKSYAELLLVEVDEQLTKAQTLVVKKIIDQCEYVRDSWFSITEILEANDDTSI